MGAEHLYAGGVWGVLRFNARKSRGLIVEANASHRFHSITEDLTTLVFFAPAES